MPVTFRSSRGRLYAGTAVLLRSLDRPSDPALALVELGLPAALPSLRGTARPEVDPLPRRWSAASGCTGALGVSARWDELSIQEPEELGELLLEPDPELEPEFDEEDDPESLPLGTADPVVGLSAGLPRSCAQAGDRLSESAAASPIENPRNVIQAPPRTTVRSSNRPARRTPPRSLAFPYCTPVQSPQFCHISVALGHRNWTAFDVGQDDPEPVAGSLGSQAL